MASSISKGEMTSPPLLMISFERPLMKRYLIDTPEVNDSNIMAKLASKNYPSLSMKPMSPESNHPSLVNVELSRGTLRSGETSYPSKVGAPRTQIAPVVLRGISCSRFPGLRIER